MRPFFSLLVLLLLLPSAHADMDEARLAYEEGRWREASEHAQRAGGAEGYAYAAGALVAQLMVEPDLYQRRNLARQALRLAEHGYRLDEDSLDARLRLASALGFHGRYMSSWRAYAMRVPQRGRRLLEEIVQEDPNNAWAVGMLGTWHLEVARRGGDRGMQALGADIDAGIGFLSNAIALDPQNPAPRYFLALSLLALDDPGRIGMAHEQVALALQLAPRDAFETGIIAEAERLQALLDDRDAAADWADDRMRR